MLANCFSRLLFCFMSSATLKAEFADITFPAITFLINAELIMEFATGVLNSKLSVALFAAIVPLTWAQLGHPNVKEVLFTPWLML